jgi:hypothetical protein
MSGRVTFVELPQAVLVAAARVSRFAVQDVSQNLGVDARGVRDLLQPAALAAHIGNKGSYEVVHRSHYSRSREIAQGLDIPRRGTIRRAVFVLLSK